MSGEPTIFTRIINGELPCHKVYEDELIIAFLDIQPLTRGHTLVIPKEPAPSMDQLSLDSAAALGRALPIVSRAVLKVTGATAYNLIQNNGQEAGMSIPHVHIHIIPRYPDSTHSFLWKYGKIDQDEAKTLAESSGHGRISVFTTLHPPSLVSDSEARLRYSQSCQARLDWRDKRSSSIQSRRKAPWKEMGSTSTRFDV